MFPESELDLTGFYVIALWTLLQCCVLSLAACEIVEPAVEKLKDQFELESATVVAWTYCLQSSETLLALYVYV